MAKITFSKLGLSKDTTIKELDFNGNIIEIKQYLPIQDKVSLITQVLGLAVDDNTFYSPMNIKIITDLEIIFSYTNISFTDKQKEDAFKLYDLLYSSGLIKEIFNYIPEEELDFIRKNIKASIDNIYAYKNSILGIINTIVTDYKDVDLDAQKIQDKIGDSNLQLIKDVVTKLD